MEDFISVDIESFSYGKKEVDLFKDLKWQITRENWLLCGDNGIGKSTLLKILAGILPLKKGTIQKNEQVTLGMVFQNNALFDHLNTIEQLQFVTEKRNTGQGKIESYLKKVGLSEAKSKMPTELSGGMRKRLALIRGLILSPTYLFCDDPTAGLDPITSQEIIEFLISEAKENQISIVVAGQPRHFYQRYFDKGYLIENQTGREFQIGKLQKEFPHL